VPSNPNKDAVQRALLRAGGGGGGGGTWETGAAYYDAANYLYVAYGADGNWQATRADLTSTLSTAAGQTGTKPTTLAALQALSYS